ncbi:TetR/AcrR family transcriptional regulator [Deinococcus altitudinis]|uniref:TetR/AcrR family transcriptional regulator n=1 Tax=Deinococcus altitudinis TaxID=468914 RepID=UPI003892C530
MSRNSVLEGNSSVQDTQQHILAVALRLMQTGGYHAFSYADVAAEVGITKASIHYHYPSKADLGTAGLRQYRVWWRTQVHGLTAPSGTPSGPPVPVSGSGVPGIRNTSAGHPDTAALLRSYSRVYRDMLRGGRICLVAALAPESLLLPQSMQAELRGFYTEHTSWLQEVLESGRATGDVTAPGPLRVQAQALLSALHGAQGLARVQGDVYRYCAVAHLTLAGLGLPFTELEISDPAAFEAQNLDTQNPAAEPSESGLTFA